MTDIKCSAYMGMSVDGFIARADGDIEWLGRPEFSAPDNLGLDYTTFMSTVDALVMGRKSFEKVASFPEWPYEKLVVVLSTQNIEFPEHLADKVRLERGSPSEIVARLQAEGLQHLYIDGGVTVQQFLHAGLISELTITYLPILLGDGISLFASIGKEIPLTHVETTVSSNGITQTRYKIKTNAIV